MGALKKEENSDDRSVQPRFRIGSHHPEEAHGRRGGYLPTPAVELTSPRVQGDSDNLRRSGCTHTEAFRPLGGLQDPCGSEEATTRQPRGHGVHHYHFKVYALDIQLDTPAGLTKDELLEAIEGHVLDEGELIGTYER